MTAVLSPRDVLELTVLDETGDAGLAEHAGRIAEAEVAAYADMYSLWFDIPVERIIPELWQMLIE